MKFGTRVFLILVVVVVCCCSCKKEPPYRSPAGETSEKITGSILAGGEIELATVPGDYIYRSVQMGRCTYLLKYHILSGTVSTVCQDPFCMHETMTCPFAISDSQLAAIGNVLYYAKEQDGISSIYSYNGEDMKTERVYTGKGSIYGIYTYQYDLYFSDSEQIDLEQSHRVFYRLDTETMEKTMIMETDGNMQIYEIKNRQIIWRKGRDSYFVSDLNGEDLRTYSKKDRVYGKYSYREEFNGTQPTSFENYIFDLYRTNLETGEDELVAKDIGPTYFYGDKILYFKSTGKTLTHTDPETGNKYYDYFGGNVYVMNLDGSDNHLLCHADDCWINSMSTSRNNELSCGDWVGIILKNYYQDDFGEEIYCTTDMLIVNLVTGEYTVARYNPFE